MKLITDPKIKHRIRLVSWTLFAVLVGVFIASLFFNNTWYKKIPHLKENIFSLKVNYPTKNTASVVQVIAPTPITPNEAPTTPQYYYVNKDESGGPKVSAKAFLVGDLNTGEVILSKNQDQKFPIASVSKLMTALVTSKIMSPDDTAKVTKVALTAEGRSEGQNGELEPGETIKVADLLYPLLLESSNSAAEVLAEYFGKNDFISKMNEEAENLKMSSTSYGDPSGLSINNQSTASDLFKLTGYLVQNNPDLIKITTYRSYSDKKQSWSNISQFLSDAGYMGGKSGYTDAALQTDVALYSLPLGQAGSRPIAITLLQSNDRKKDIETIVKYLNKNIYYGGPADANTNWVTERIGAPDLGDPDYVTLAFGGDIMLDRGVRASVVKNFNDDYSALFENLNIFKNSDIAFANLEGTASDQGKNINNLYSFRMDPDVIPTLKGAGISILSVANNHVGDWGLPAFTDTLSRLKENEIQYTGGGLDKTEAKTPTIIEKNGIKIGFLGFSDVGPDNMGADVNEPGILLANDPDFNQIIKNASKQVDDLVVSFHFGVEYQAKHDARQELLAHEAIDDGAKIIIGSHPHVAEDTEVYKNGYIAYSLGNLVFDQSASANTMEGLLLEMKLYKDGSLYVKKDTTQLNSAFQIEKVTEGKEEQIKFPATQNNTQTALK
jgi:D-alanyl-D-alanine carboxypeptidase